MIHLPAVSYHPTPQEQGRLPTRCGWCREERPALAWDPYLRDWYCRICGWREFEVRRSEYESCLSA